MIFRFGFLVVVSVAAYGLKQMKSNFSRNSTSLVQPSENGDSSFRQFQSEGDEKEQFVNSSFCLGKEQMEDKEEEEEEIEGMRSIISSILKKSRVNQDDEEPILPEQQYHLCKEVQFQFVVENDNWDVNKSTEIEQLGYLVKKLQEREAMLKARLIALCSFKEQESVTAELKRHLKIKTTEIETLNITINSLQGEGIRLREERANGILARKQLETAKTKIEELQKKIQMDANQTKGQLLIIKQQISGFQTEEVPKRDAKIEKKLKALRELHMEVMELKRRSKELELEKRALKFKLAALSNLKESKMVAKVKEEINCLRKTNEDVAMQMERLQNKKFSVVEELVYQRWINACLRNEIQSYHKTPSSSGKASAQDLEKRLRPKSQEKPKHKNSRTDNEQLDTDFNITSLSESEELERSTIDSFTSISTISKKPSLIQKIKRWRRNKDDFNAVSSQSMSSGESSSSKTSISRRSSMSMDSMESTMRNFPRSRRVSFSDSVELMDGMQRQKLPLAKENASMGKVEQTSTEIYYSDSLDLSASFEYEADPGGEKAVLSSQELKKMEGYSTDKTKLQSDSHSSKVDTRIKWNVSPTNINKVDIQGQHFVAVFFFLLLMLVICFLLLTKAVSY